MRRSWYNPDRALTPVLEKNGSLASHGMSGVGRASCWPLSVLRRSEFRTLGCWGFEAACFLGKGEGFRAAYPRVCG